MIQYTGIPSGDFKTQGPKRCFGPNTAGAIKIAAVCARYLFVLENFPYDQKSFYLILADCSNKKCILLEFFR